MCHIIIKHKGNDFLAQLVEQLTLNQWVEGSSPSEVTIRKLSGMAVFCDLKVNVQNGIVFFHVYRKSVCFAYILCILHRFFSRIMVK